ncbi:hypothetical protein [Arthrobacter sp. TE12232]
MNAPAPVSSNPTSPTVISHIGGNTSFAWWPSYRIEMAQTYGTGKSLQCVALHECAHIASFS